MFMSYYQTTKQNHYTKVANKSFKNVVKLKYLGTVVKNQNCIYDKIKSSLNLGNAHYRAVQNLLSSCLLSKNIKIKMCKTIMPDIIRIMKSRSMRWVWHVACMGEMRNLYVILVGKPEGKRPLRRPRRR
jgi:hypothetical protein